MYGTKIILHIGRFICVCQLQTCKDHEAQTQHPHNCYIPVTLHDRRHFNHLHMSTKNCMAALRMRHPRFENWGI